MKRLFLIPLVLFLACENNNSIDINKLINKDGRRYRSDTSNPFTGRAYHIINDEMYSKSFYDFKNGFRHGKEIRYYKNGSLFMEVDWKNEKMHGKYLWFYENGQKWKETDYNNDIVEGKDIMWYENGNKNLEANYRNGKIDGLYQAWHENGSILVKGNHINYLRHGQWIWYDKVGTINRSEKYDNGVLLSSDTF